MSTESIIAVPQTTAKDYLTSSGRERIAFSKVVKQFDTLITPYIEHIVKCGEEWEIIVSQEKPQSRHPSSVILNARNKNGALELRVDHREEWNNPGWKSSRGSPGEPAFWSLNHRRTVLTIQDGGLLTISTGREHRSDYADEEENSSFLSHDTNEWQAFRPELHITTTLKDQTDTLKALIQSLKAAIDDSGLGLYNEVP